MSGLLALIGRLLPGLAPALAGFLNPWLILGAVLALGAAFAYGWHVRAEIAQGFEDSVELIGQLQEERTKTRIERDRRLKEAADVAHAKELDALNARISALVVSVSVGAGRSFLPAGTADPDVPLPITAARLDRALQDFDQEIRSVLGEAAGLVGEGAKAVAALECGRDWAQKVGQP